EQARHRFERVGCELSLTKRVQLAYLVSAICSQRANAEAHAGYVSSLVEDFHEAQVAPVSPQTLTVVEAEPEERWHRHQDARLACCPHDRVEPYVVQPEGVAEVLAQPDLGREQPLNQFALSEGPRH